jgi:uncharacterized protein YdeI (YjbR/CyaY-like superfamily)
MAMITEIDAYFDKGCGRCARFATPDCSSRHWNEGLRALRRICLDVGMSETVKWGHPCYMHAGRNIAILGAFRDDFRLTFVDGALMADPEGVLTRRGQNSRARDVLAFRDAAEVARIEATLLAYLAEAMGYAAAGIRAEKAREALDLPEELVAALDADPELAEAFTALTPGRQKSYVLNLAGAKKPETRIARIEKFRDKILAGKGALDR